MKTSFEVNGEVNGKLTFVIEEEDLREKTDKKLKELRRKANIPGFRPGTVPMSIIRRQFEEKVRYEQTNELLNEGLKNFLETEKVQLIGQPLEALDHEPVDLAKPAPYTFVFDLPLKPNCEFSLTKDDILDYYQIEVADEMIDEQVNLLASDPGHYEKAEEYSPELRDILKGDLRQLDENGSNLEGGITVAEAILMPLYMSDDEQKALFDKARLGDVISFNPRKAYAGNNAEIAGLLKMKKDDVEGIESDFSFQVTEISRYVSAPVNQELFDKVFGEGVVSDEEDFRKKVAEQISAQFTVESDWRLLVELRQYAFEKIKDVALPVELIKRLVKANNKDKDDAFIEEHMQENLDYLKWEMVKAKLAEQFAIKVEEDEMKGAAKEMARSQYAQYGINNMPDEYLEKAAKDILKDENSRERVFDRIIDRKIILAAKQVVSLNVKSISAEEFRKLAQG